MDTILEVARAILIIGWALCVLVFFFLLLTVLQLAMRISGLVWDIRYKYDMLQQYVLMPFKRLSKFLEEDDD